MSNEDENPELETQLELGRRLYGNKVRFHHWPPGTGIKCTKLYANGMVELHGMTGQFAPSLFEIDEVIAVPLEGKVN